MHPIRFFSIVAAFALATNGNAQTAAPDSYTQNVEPLLKSFCVRCHGETSQKADRRFDSLNGTIQDSNELVDYQDILDQLNLGEMPPADAKQPSDDQRKRAIKWLTARIGRYHAQHSQTSNRSVLRRLNAREYRNSVADLLHLDMRMFDPTAAFPRDETIEHLDNVGETLVTSGYLLSRYLTAAEQVVDKAMSPTKRPPIQTWEFNDSFRQQREIDQVHKKTNGFKHLTLYDCVGADKPEGAYAPLLAFSHGVPIDGFYEIEFTAHAINRLHPYDPKFLGTDPSQPLRLGIVAGNEDVGNLHVSQPIEPLLAEIELADQRRTYTRKIWLDAGYTPRFTFRNGLMDARNLWSKLIKKYRDQFPKDIDRGIVAARFNAIKHGKLPQIHIDDIVIRGPIYQQWPTASHRALLGNDWEQVVATGKLPPEVMRKHLKRFASKAYRRPATDNELERITQVIHTRLASGRRPLEAYGDGIMTVLASPSFLYLDEGDTNELPPHALASRLSYFLWASTPDAELRRLADSGKLSDDAILTAQVKRMLADPKSDRFVEGFLASWLTMRDLGSAPPDRSKFRSFYQYDLDHAMREETRLFTRHLIDENLSLVNFLDSKFTFVNRRLAEAYKIDAPRDPGFHRVALTDPRRGGLLGQASVLTVTANGIDTSPVTRGVWLLENILGTPPSPPPPDVEPLDPDIRGAKTIRDQLSKHRDNASCNDCHRKIDPLGFALENFDPIGRWRESYGRNTKIDAAGELPNGKTFKDIVGLKKILLQQKELFAKALTEKMLAYAIGRPIHASDRPAVDAILNQLKQKGWGTQDLIKQIVVSQPFKST